MTSRKEGLSDRQTNGLTDRHKETDGHGPSRQDKRIMGQTDRQTDRQTDGQTDRQTDGSGLNNEFHDKTDGQWERQTDRRSQSEQGL